LASKAVQRTDPEDVVGGSERRDRSLDDVLQTLQKQPMKLEDAVDAAEQLLHLVVRQERLASQWFQVAVDQIHQVLYVTASIYGTHFLHNTV